jgi:hypothetical protein
VDIEISTIFHRIHISCAPKTLGFINNLAGKKEVIKRWFIWCVCVRGSHQGQEASDFFYVALLSAAKRENRWLPR